MERAAHHDALLDETGGTAAPTEEGRKAARVRTVFKPLFAAALTAALALSGACGWLVEQQQAALLRQFELDRRVAQLEQELSRQMDLSQQQREELERRGQELEQAQDTIGLLEEYSMATPEGVVPGYTQIYPEMYVQPWEGERIDGGKVCCLTFDDGPSPNTDRVLEVLGRYGIKATFFVVGKTGQQDQERMRSIVAAGHTIAMHSWSHDYKSVYASVDAFLEEFHRLYQWIYEVTGVYPQVFRFPGGSINGYDRGVYQEIIAEMTRRGFVYFDWNASAQDATVYPRPAWDISADCLKGIGRELVVVLAHDSAARSTTVDALPAIIEGYQNAGYTLAALHPGVEPVHMGYPKIH